MEKSYEMPDGSVSIAVALMRARWLRVISVQPILFCLFWFHSLCFLAADRVARATAGSLPIVCPCRARPAKFRDSESCFRLRLVF